MYFVLPLLGSGQYFEQSRWLRCLCLQTDPAARSCCCLRVVCIRCTITAMGRITDFYTEVLAAAIPDQTSVGRGWKYFCGTYDRINMSRCSLCCVVMIVVCLPLSQCRPSKFTGQIQMYAFIWSTHVAPFWHGPDWQWSSSEEAKHSFTRSEDTVSRVCCKLVVVGCQGISMQLLCMIVSSLLCSFN